MTKNLTSLTDAARTQWHKYRRTKEIKHFPGESLMQSAGKEAAGNRLWKRIGRCRREE